MGCFSKQVLFIVYSRGLQTILLVIIKVNFLLLKLPDISKLNIFIKKIYSIRTIGPVHKNVF